MRFLPLLSRLRSPRSRAQSAEARRTVRPLLEELECRLAPAINTWTGGPLGNANFNWSNAANWSLGRAPEAGDDLVFGAVANVASKTNRNNIPGLSVNSITFADSGYTIQNHPTLAPDLILGSSAANTGFIIANLGATNNTISSNLVLGGAAGNRQFFTVGTTSAVLTISGQIKGNTGVELSKDGPGTLILSGNNNLFTGVISIVEGPLNVRHANALGTPDSPTVVLSSVNNSAQLQVENVTGAIAETLRLNGAGIANNGALLNIAGNNVWTGSIILDSNATIGAAADSLTLHGVISDTASGHNLTKEGVGRIILDPLNTAQGNIYRGRTFVNDGVLTIRHSLALGNQTTVVQGVNDTVVNSFPNRNGTLQLEFNPLITLPTGFTRIDPNANATNDGFLVPFETLVLNGPGNTAAGVGTLSNIAGNNTWQRDIYLWSDNTTMLFPNINLYAELDTNLTIHGPIRDDNITNTNYNLRKTGEGRVIFVSPPGFNNTYRGFTQVVDGYLNIRDSRALGAAGTAANGTVVFSGATLEIEADDIPDSNPVAASPDGTPHLNTDIIIAAGGEQITINGSGAGGNGALRNIRGTNEITGNLILSGGATIGVEPDLAPFAQFDLSQLTLSGVVSGGSLSKVGLGELVLTDVANTYTGGTFIREGWITIRHDRSLGGAIAGPDTIQPPTYIAEGAALHLRQTRSTTPVDLVVAERLFVSGDGITHRFPEFNHRGAILNLSGNTTLTGVINLVGTANFPQVGIGVEIANSPNIPADQNVTQSSLTITNLIQEQPPSANLALPTIPPPSSTLIPSGINKLGRKRLTIQSQGTYTGNNTITEGILRIQHSTALGWVDGVTTVQSGAALEVMGYDPFQNGGLPGGLQVRESLILNGPGNTTADDPTHNYSSPVFVHAFVNLTDDNIWNGPITFDTNLVIDTKADTRLALWKPIGGPGGFTKVGDGKLILGAVNSYNGDTIVESGILNLQSPGALGSPVGQTIVRNNAQLELQGDITISGERLTLEGNGPDSTPNLPVRWFPQGPAPLTDPQWNGSTATGRITGVAVDPFDSDVMYVSAAGGGAWRTKNGGFTWEPLIDRVVDPLGVAYPNQVIFTGAIAVAPTNSNVIYVALGESNNSSDSFYGRGILRSTDYGRTWTLLAGPTNTELNRHSVSKIVVDPVDSNTFYVATSVFQTNGTGGNSGIWRYQNGAWTNLTLGQAPTDDAGAPPVVFDGNDVFSDLMVFQDTASPGNRIIVMAVGEADGSFNNAAYLSMDSGATWTRRAFPKADTVNAVLVPHSGTIKLGGTWSPTTPPPVTPGRYDFYAAVTWPDRPFVFPNPYGTFREIFRLQITWNVATGTWTVGNWALTPSQPQATNPAGYQGDQGFYNSVVAVRPQDPNYVFLGGVGQPFTAGPLVSTNGGTSWNDIGNAPGRDPHVSYHAVAWTGTTTAAELVVGTDGGIWRLDGSTPGGIQWTNLNGNFLQISQFKGLDVHPFDPFSAIGGLQGNGTVVYDDSYIWTSVNAGEGGNVQINNKNPNVVFQVGSVAGGSVIFRSLNGGAAGSWVAIPSFVGGVDDIPFILDRVNPSRLLRANGGTLFESMNSDTAGTPTFISIGSFAGTILSIAVADRQGKWAQDLDFPLAQDLGADTYDSNTIYVLTTNGVMVTKNGGQTWQNRSDGIPPFADFVELVVDPRNRDTAYIVSNEFGTPHIMRTRSAGQDPDGVGPNRGWTNISGNLPNLPTWSVVVDSRNGDVFVGNDNGVYRLTGDQLERFDRGELLASELVWERFGVGLPNVQVTQLVINPRNNTLSVGTYGRGFYQLFLDYSQTNSGALRVVSGSAVWAGEINVIGNLDIRTDVDAQLNIVGRLTDNGAGHTINKVGGGRLILSAANDYVGLTDVQQGTLTVRHPGALGGSNPTTGRTVIHTGSVLELQSNLVGETVELNGNGMQFSGHYTGALRNVSNDNTFTGTLILNQGAQGPSNNAPLPSDLRDQITIGVDSGSSLTIGSRAGLPGVGTIVDASGAVLLTKELTGTLILNSANTYQGITQVNQGILRVAHSNALGGSAGGTEVRNTAKLQLSADANGNGITIVGESLAPSGAGIVNTGAVENISGDNIWRGPVTLQAITALPAPPPGPPPTVVTFGVLNGSSLTLDGAIGEQGGMFGIDKVGVGRLVFTSANTYSGTTTVREGTLSIRDKDSLGAGVPEAQTLTVNGTTGIFRLSFNGQTTIGISANSGTLSNDIQNALNALSTIGGVGGSVSVLQGIPGPNSFRITFGGNLAFLNVPQITATIVSGTVTASVTTFQEGPGDTVVNNGATLELDLGPGNHTFLGETLTLNGNGVGGVGALNNVSGDNAWTVEPIVLATSAAIGVAGGSLTVSSDVQGGLAATLTKVGDGTLRFPFANSYLGATVISNGVVQIANANALGPVAGLGTTVQSGGTLELTSGITVTTEALSLAGPGEGGRGALSNAAGASNTWRGDIVLTDHTTLGAMGTTANVLTIDGAISQSNGSWTVTKVGPGAVAYVGGTSNTYTGFTSVEEGDLLLNKAPVSEVQRLTILGSSGTFTVSFQGQTTPIQPFNVSGAALQTALESLVTIGPGNVSVVQNANVYTITFTGTLALSNQPLLVAQGFGAATANVVVVQEGTSVAVALQSDLFIGDGVGAARVRWLAPNQMLATSDVFVATDGTMDLNGFQQTIDTLEVAGGRVDTGAATGHLTVLGSIAGTSTTTSGRINGAGVLDLGSNVRVFGISDGPQAVDLSIDVAIQNGGVWKLGGGVLELNAVNPYTDGTVISGGAVLVNAPGAIQFVFLDGGTIGGTGTVGAIQAGAMNGGGVSPGTSTEAGVLDSGSVQWNANTVFRVDLNGPTPGDGVGFHDQLNVIGTVNLGGAHLTGSVNFVPALGSQFTILQSTAPITNRFAEGESVFLSGFKFRVIYNSNSVVLERILADANTVITTARLLSPVGPVRLEATVGGEAGATFNDPPSTGTVDFFDGVKFLGTANVVNGIASLDVSLATLAAIRPHSVTARFNGNADFNPNTSAPVLFGDLTLVDLQPNSPLQTPVTALTMTFNRSVDLVSLDLSDLTLVGPNGPISLAVAFLSPNANRTVWTLDLSAAPLTEPGVYTLSVGPAITDDVGFGMDQNGNSIYDEPSPAPLGDVFQESFVVGGLRVLNLATSPASPVLDTVGVHSATLTFNMPVGTLTLGDLELMGPNGLVPLGGAALTPNAARTVWTLTFAAPVQQPGTYTLTVRPTATDPLGNPMNQDNDGVFGENPADAFVGNFTVVGLKVVALGPPSPLPNSLNQAVITFNQPVDPATFTLDDLTLTGPAGIISLFGSSLTSNAARTIWTLTLASPPAQAGVYTLTVGPNVNDDVGFAMDQNGDGLLGTGNDIFVGSMVVRGLAVSSIATIPPGTALSSTGISSAIITFNMGVGTFTTADLELRDPLGATVDLSGAFLVPNFERTVWTLVFPSVLTRPGNWILTVKQTVTDAGGNLMNQNGNAVVGEPGVDAFMMTLPIVGLRVNSVESPIMPVLDSTGLSLLEIRFNQPVAVGSFDLSDLVLTGPQGNVSLVGATLSPNPSRTIWTLTLPTPQTRMGGYQLRVGPNITDDRGFAMDQNGDGMLGQANDSFTGTVTVTGLAVIGVVPNSLLSTVGMSSITVIFNEGLQANSLQLATSLVGPAGAITPLSFTDVSGGAGSSWRISFAPQTALGVYTLTIGSTVVSIAGNAMDQNQNGVQGEVLGDRFTMPLIVADPPPPPVESFAETPAPVSFIVTRRRRGNRFIFRVQLFLFEGAELPSGSRLVLATTNRRDRMPGAQGRLRRGQQYRVFAIDTALLRSNPGLTVQVVVRTDRNSPNLAVLPIFSNAPLFAVL